MLWRVAAVEPFDEAPDLRVLADEFGGEDTETVNGAFVEIGFDQQHRRPSARFQNRGMIRARHGRKARRGSALHRNPPSWTTRAARPKEGPQNSRTSTKQWIRPFCSKRRTA